MAFSQPIKVGSLNNGMRVVLEGLKGDEKVIISGMQRFKTGDEVKSITPAEEGSPKPAGDPAEPKSPARVGLRRPPPAEPVAHPDHAGLARRSDADRPAGGPAIAINR